MKRFGVSTHLYHEERLQTGAPARDCGARIRRRRGVRHAKPLRLSRPGRDSSAEGLAGRGQARPAFRPRADHRRIRERPGPAQLLDRAPRHRRAKGDAARDGSRAEHRDDASPSSSSSSTSACPSRSSPRSDDNNREAAIRSIEEIHADGRAARREGRARGDGQQPLDGARPRRDARAHLRRRRSGHLHGRRPRAHPRGHGRSHRDDVRISGDDAHPRQPAAAATTISSPSRAASTGPPTIMAFEKIGYDGVLMYEVKAAQSPRAVLERAVRRAAGSKR